MVGGGCVRKGFFSIPFVLRRSSDAARGVGETQRPGTDEEEEERKEGADRTTQQAGGQENELFEVQGPVASRIEAEILAE